MGDILAGLVPRIPSGDPDVMFYVLGLAGGVGGTITLGAYAYWLREKGWNVPKYMRVMKFDNATSYILTGIFVMSKGWMEKNNALKPGNTSTGVTTYASTHADGTGPFKLESYEPDAKTVLSANGSWWDKPQHNLQRIEFRPIKSDATRVAALLSGEIDMIASMPLACPPPSVACLPLMLTPSRLIGPPPSTPRPSTPFVATMLLAGPGPALVFPPVDSGEAPPPWTDRAPRSRRPLVDTISLAGLYEAGWYPPDCDPPGW